MKTILTLLTLSLSLVAMAQTAEQPLFNVTKNHNPHNYLKYSAVVENCRLVKQVVKAEWIHSKENNRVGFLNKREAAHLSPILIPGRNENHAEFTLNAIRENISELPDSKITIRMENCQAKAYAATDEYGEIQLSEIFAHIKVAASIVAGKPSIPFIIIKGKDAVGREVSLRLNR
jgi:hypothetical protein